MEQNQKPHDPFGAAMLLAIEQAGALESAIADAAAENEKRLGRKPSLNFLKFLDELLEQKEQLAKSVNTLPIENREKVEAILQLEIQHIKGLISKLEHLNRILAAYSAIHAKTDLR